MAFNYTNAQATALRLLQNFGQVVTMSRTSAGTFDPGTGTTSGATVTSQQIQVASVPGSVGQSGLFSDMRKEALVKGRLRFFIASATKPDGTALDFEPAPGDRVTFQGKQWEVFGNTPLAPGGVTVVNEFSAMEGGAS